MTRDPEIERIHDDLDMTCRAEANRAIMVGAAFAVILCILALAAVVVAAYRLAA